ncbi:MAG: 1-acyl-sn-glycerol-3-phosphate acyltransferase [Spirochaetia bacterium]|jgi:glycerol-3-phosphate O-acyltransferase
MHEESVLNNSKYVDIIRRMIDSSTGSPMVTEQNVYQEGNPTNKPLVRQIVQDLLLPGSRIVGREHLSELRRLAQRKKACLVLMEHYSNFDIPCFYELLERGNEEMQKVADSIVSVAGVKLNETSKLVLAFTEVFTRVVLYPARSFGRITDPRQLREAEKRRARINIAAMKMLNALRKQGRLILVFPSGTRYRPWDPSTGRGLREIDTYLKFYSYMVTVAVNGNCLIPNPNDRMDEDFVARDVMIYTASPVRKCSEFRREALRRRGHVEDPKQHVADRVMTTLGQLHERTERARLRLLAEQGLGTGGQTQLPQNGPLH